MIGQRCVIAFDIYFGDFHQVIFTYLNSQKLIQCTSRDQIFAPKYVNRMMWLVILSGVATSSIKVKGALIRLIQDDALFSLLVLIAVAQNISKNFPLKLLKLLRLSTEFFMFEAKQNEHLILNCHCLMTYSFANGISLLNILKVHFTVKC